MNPTKLVAEHEQYRRRRLNLVASENILSPAARRALASDLAGRYAFRPEFYGGTKYARKLWDAAEQLGREVFNAEFCSVAPLSGHVALMTALYSTVSKGQKIAVIASEHGGYPGLDQDKIPEIFSLQTVQLPFNSSEQQLELWGCLDVIRGEKPSVVILGASLILFPQPVREIAEEVHSYGGAVIFDGSHVLGLIAGHTFPNPLNEGADILLGSTHKSFPGPQGGIILTNNRELASRIESNTLHKFVDNIHLNRVAALAVALEEMRRYGSKYAPRIVENAKTLAAELDKAGINVFKGSRGYTETHQVYIPKNPDEGVWFRDRLEEAGIVVDMAVRLGTNEVARLGMGAREMREVAALIKLALDGHAGQARRGVARLLRRFKKIRYALQ
ncbi:MAG: aminotransferase class I/II-fold pyridoxal phosphate-dependent enzyme [Aigarchaeota archaeon]|nr:aminotransferase class I/II-fold pyridoxal phosphate-dependent enzyme [Candidatus Pelearchaeum maunauluense]